LHRRIVETEALMASRASSPVFLVAAPRSGTTLLRLILDAHPEIGCPSETGIPTLAAHLARVWTTISSDLAGEPVSDLPPKVIASMRRTLTAPMDLYCRERGKRIYCDKSLDAPEHLGALGRVFPRASYLLLFRHVLDVVASGLEVSAYGFQGFGYPQYVQRSVGNFVAPLVEHWVARVRWAMDWERANKALCHSVRYEDLVADPEAELSAIFSFLGVSADLSSIQRALHAVPDTKTYGDPKVAFTSSIHTQSIGRGRRVPISLIPPLLLAEANELLAMLGYERVTETWNVEPAAARPPSASPDARRLGKLMPKLLDLGALRQRSGDFAIVVDDAKGMAWQVDRGSGLVKRSRAAPAATTLYGTAAALLAMLEGEENAGTMFGDGRLRVGGAPGEPRRSVTRDVALLVRALQASLAAR
jgi:protein-tyrosine sulfotransferase